MIYVPEHYYKLNEEEYAVAVTLLYMKVQAADETCVELSCMYYYMFGETKPEDRLRRSLCNALGDLANKKLNKTLYVVDNSFFERDEEEHFARLYYEDVQKILRSDYKNKCFLVKYYGWLMKSVNNKTNVGTQTIQYFASGMSCSMKTIERANERLEELGIIYVRHSSAIMTSEDGEFYSVPNIYGNWRDVGAINKYADKYFGGISNNAKSIGSKIAWLRKGKAYPDNEVQEMYDYAANHNIEIMTRQKSGALIDMKVFDSYSIVRNENYELFA